MRQIKFRAWDGKEFYVPYADGHGYFYHGNAAIDMGETTKDPVMQYTGFKDKSGIEIYEGDIVESTAEDGFKDDHPDRVVSDIIFSPNTAFTVRTVSKDMPWDFYQHGLSLAWGAWAEIKVIGTIYSNPELLNGPQEVS